MKGVYLHQTQCFEVEHNLSIFRQLIQKYIRILKSSQNSQHGGGGAENKLTRHFDRHYFK